MGFYAAGLNILSIPGNSLWSSEQFLAAASGAEPGAELNTMTLMDGFQPSPEAGVPLVPVVHEFSPSTYRLTLAALADGKVDEGFQMTAEMLRSGIKTAFPGLETAPGRLQPITPDRWPSGWRLRSDRQQLKNDAGERLRYTFRNEDSGRFFQIAFNPSSRGVSIGWNNSRAQVMQSAESSALLRIAGASYAFGIVDPAVVQQLLGVPQFDVAAIIRAAVRPATYSSVGFNGYPPLRQYVI